MVFSGIPFLYYFLPAVLILYYLVPARGKNPVLLAASLFFYGYGEPRFLLLMLMAILQGYGFALLTERQRDRRRRRIRPSCPQSFRWAFSFGSSTRNFSRTAFGRLRACPCRFYVLPCLWAIVFTPFRFSATQRMCTAGPARRKKICWILPAMCPL